MNRPRAMRGRHGASLGSSHAFGEFSAGDDVTNEQDEKDLPCSCDIAKDAHCGSPILSAPSMATVGVGSNACDGGWAPIVRDTNPAPRITAPTNSQLKLGAVEKRTPAVLAAIWNPFSPQ